jgi:TPR repeat protein
MKNLIVCLSAILMLLSGLANAGQYKDAVVAYYKGDFVQAFKLFQPLAEQGNASAQQSVGEMYENSKGVTQDYAQAVDWYRKAAVQGDFFGQYKLGIIYAEGKGVTQDFVRAHMWFNLSAAQFGSYESVQHRDEVAGKMTPAQIAEAQKLARECEQRNYKNCD